MIKPRFPVYSVVLLVVWLFCPGVCPAEKTSLPLSDLAGRSTADIRGLSGKVYISLPIPERWLVNKADLLFEFTNSTGLLAERSRITVRLNDYPLAQVKLRPRSPEGQAEIELPPELLLPEYNQLVFEVTQTYTEKCADPSVAELWTTLLLDRSSLILDYQLEDVPLNLADLAEFVFDPKQPGPNRIHLALADYGTETLRSAALAAAAAAMRFKYRPVEFSLSRDLDPGRDNIIIGPTSYVEPTLAKWGRPKPEGNIGIGSMPRIRKTEKDGAVKEEIIPDPGRAYLFLTGPDQAAVERSARALTVMNFPWPGVGSAKIGSVDLPPINRYSCQGMVRPGAKYAFRDLGFETRAMAGLTPGPAEVTFRLPTELYIRPNDIIVVSLHLVYSAGLRRDSTLRFLINDRFAGALPLNEADGARYRNYILELPARLLRKGRNKIGFQPRPIPEAAGECVHVNTDNLSVTVYDDSTIRLPVMPHWTALPDLELLVQDGFPYGEQPDWGRSTVFLADPGPDSALAAISFLALISQINGVAPYRVKFTRTWPAAGADAAGDDLLAFGRLSDLPAGVKETWPLKDGLIYPFVDFRDRLKTVKSWWTKFRETLTPPDPSRPEQRPVTARLGLEATLEPGRLLLVQYGSPLAEQRTVTAVVAAESKDLVAGAAALWRPNVRAGLKDGLALIDLGKTDKASIRVRTQPAGAAYQVGRVGRIYWLDNLVHSHPWPALGALLISLAVLAFVIYRLLRMFRRRRIAPGEEQ